MAKEGHNGPETRHRRADHRGFEGAGRRDECLKENWFSTLQEARQIIEAWRVDYNQVRPHSSLGDLAPEEFAAKKQAAVTTKPTQGLNLSIA